MSVLFCLHGHGLYAQINDDPLLADGYSVKSEYVEECQTNTPLRRHFIIAVDGSGSFYKLGEIEMAKNGVKRLLLQLFANDGSSDNIDNKIKRELENGVDFYNPLTDKVTLYKFGMTQDNLTKTYSKICLIRNME